MKLDEMMNELRGLLSKRCSVRWSVYSPHAENRERFAQELRELVKDIPQTHLIELDIENYPDFVALLHDTAQGIWDIPGVGEIIADTRRENLRQAAGAFESMTDYLADMFDELREFDGPQKPPLPCLLLSNFEKCRRWDCERDLAWLREFKISALLLAPQPIKEITDKPTGSPLYNCIRVRMVEL